MENETTITGGCFCGTVNYRVNGVLRDARSCHCSRCRKAFSAQASAYALVEPREFTWVSGEHLLSTYTGEHGFGLRFCSKCGSTLCGIYEGTIHGLSLGCINGDPKIELARHIYVGSKASWEIIPDGITQYQENVPEEV